MGLRRPRALQDHRVLGRSLGHGGALAPLSFGRALLLLLAARPRSQHDRAGERDSTPCLSVHSSPSPSTRGLPRYPTPTFVAFPRYNGNSSVSSRTSCFTRSAVASSRAIRTMSINSATRSISASLKP